MTAGTSRLPAHSSSDFYARLTQLQVRLVGRLHLGLVTRVTRYGLRRDLALPMEKKPAAKIPIAVRELRESDLSALLSTDDVRDNAEECLEIARRRAFVEKGIARCFVAVDKRTDTACYMQWLIAAADVEPIRQSGNFPSLQPDEALLENAFTPVRYRGLGIMSAAMSVIAERAAYVGARYVLTFVDDRNIASLKGCQRSGFHPHMMHDQAMFAFGLKKQNSFRVLAENDPVRSLTF
jgi:hypothetical protein